MGGEGRLAIQKVNVPSSAKTEFIDITSTVNEVLANLGATDGKTAKTWPHLQTALEAELGRIRVCFTKARYHAAELTEEALQQVRDSAPFAGTNNLSIGQGSCQYAGQCKSPPFADG